jgi:energy-coupling factor transport system ATP-binding protein
VPDQAIVVADRLSYRYPERDACALSDVTLELAPGGFTLLAGESGSGKSTLLRAFCGLVPHFHGGEVKGELEVAGMSVRDHGPGELAAVCGTVFQDPETQVVMGGVRAELSLPLEHRGESPSAIARAVEEVALALGIARLLDRRTDTLSGGELQRVAIAAALVHRPALLVLDEPTSQLDPVAGDELIWLLRRLNEEWGTAVVIAEHRIDRCLPAADRVVAMAGGAVVCDAAPRDYLDWAVAGGGNLATPIARLFSLAGLRPLPRSVKEARDGLRAAGLAPHADRGDAGGGGDPGDAAARGGSAWLSRLAGRRTDAGAPAVAACGVWHEIADGPAILRGVDLAVEPGERVALMGRNGAGKSTLLRHLKGLAAPTRGRVERAGEVALLLQNPGDYLIHEHAIDEAGADALGAAGLADRPDANPRDLSGGERQRLALEIVLAVDEPCAAVCLDEPTRGMDRVHKDALAARIEVLAAEGAALIVATHDTEFAAAFADRVVLMGDGVVIADGPPFELLAGGWHFSTEVARALDGAGGALMPEQGAILIERELVR